MPAILVVAGAYAGAGATGWALFAAGTMVVSGLMARKAEIDGNKDAAAGWMAVGAVAGLGAAYASSATSTAATAGADAGASAGANAGIPATQGEMLASQTAGIEGAQGTMTAAQNAAPATFESEWMAARTAERAEMARIASNNLKVQAVTGLATAGVSWQAGEEQAKIKREQVAEERRLTDQKYANTNNLVDLKVQTPTNLPNLMGSAHRQGLINATATTVK